MASRNPYRTNAPVPQWGHGTILTQPQRQPLQAPIDRINQHSQFENLQQPSQWAMQLPGTQQQDWSPGFPDYAEYHQAQRVHGQDEPQALETRKPHPQHHFEQVVRTHSTFEDEEMTDVYDRQPILPFAEPNAPIVAHQNMDICGPVAPGFRKNLGEAVAKRLIRLAIDPAPKTFANRTVYEGLLSTRDGQQTGDPGFIDKHLQFNKIVLGAALADSESTLKPEEQSDPLQPPGPHPLVEAGSDPVWTTFHIEDNKEASAEYNSRQGLQSHEEQPQETISSDQARRAARRLVDVYHPYMSQPSFRPWSPQPCEYDFAPKRLRLEYPDSNPIPRKIKISCVYDGKIKDHIVDRFNLASKSPYMRNLLSYFRNLQVYFDWCCDETFTAYVNWINTNSLPSDDGFACREIAFDPSFEDAVYVHLTHLYNLGLKLQDRQFGNAILDAIKKRHKTLQKSKIPGLACLQLAYQEEGSLGNSLQSLLAEMYARSKDQAHFDAFMATGSVPWQFFRILVERQRPYLKLNRAGIESIDMREFYEQ